MTLARFFRARPARTLLYVLLWGYTALLAGCGGNAVVLYGTGVITMQASNVDFVSYRVNIDSITLTRTDGVVVEPLAYPQTVDLAQVSKQPELVGAPAIPTGTYLSATITLDYTVPSIWVDEDGKAVELAPVGTDGNVMTVASVTVVFDAKKPLVINSQQSTRIAINMNVASFNTPNPGKTEVVVQPYAVMLPAAEDSTVLRARGLFVTEMSVSEGFVMNARPFIDQVSAIGAETINTTPATYWNINGAVYTGNAGLKALSGVQISTPIIAYGTLGSLAGITPSFTATQVYAGIMAQDPLAEDLFGVVSARSGNTLTIKGGTYFNIYLTSVTRVPTVYFDTATVTVGPATILLEDGNAAAAPTLEDISVGQQVHVYGQGTFSGTGTTLTLNATLGLLRIQPAQLYGQLNSATAASAVLKLVQLGGFSLAAFDFAGTGASAGGQDADPNNYVVSTPSSNQSATPAGTLLQVNGLVTPYGTAPPDFTASTITQASALPQQLVVVWGTNGSTKPFTTLTASELVVDLTNAQMQLFTGPQSQPLTASPTITYGSGAKLSVGVATVATLATSVAATTTPADYVTALNTALNGTNAAWRLTALGTYNKDTNSFVATSIDMNLN
jgi:hypothetical protein